MGKPKINCRINTPQSIVQKMLDILGYRENLYGQRILENSCGNGRFLIEIVKRYITDCLLNGYNDNEIRDGLTRDICAFEIDQTTFEECISNLNQLAEEHGITEVKWSVFNTDALKAEIPANFTYVIGNPPYITYSALSKADREYIRKKFSVCTEGKPDYYYAFIECGLNCLEANGRMVYLIPSNFFKTKFARQVRTFLLPTLCDVYDYKGQRIFDSAMTASTIVVCDKGVISNSIVYHDVMTNEEREIDKRLLEDRWIFIEESKQSSSVVPIRFGDRYRASSSIATLFNDAFIIEADSPELVLVESNVLRKAVSPKLKSTNTKKWIIFPYYFDEKGTLQRYSEESFKSLFPKATAHLEKYKVQLNSRDSDKTAKWFEYGRSQAIKHVDQKKLLLSTIITKNVKVMMLDEESIPYSGVYIIALKDYDLTDAKAILESPEFFEYAKTVGVRVNGSSIRIAIRDINNYVFSQ